MKKIILLLSLLFLLSSCLVKDNFSIEPVQGVEIPKIMLEKLNGEKIEISKAIDPNKKTLITIQAEWCPHCQQEAPEVQRFYEEFKDKANIIVIYSNANSSKSKVESFIKDNGYTYPTYYDSKGNITLGFNIKGFPANYIIKGNKIEKIIEGELDYNLLKENLLN